MNRPYLDRAKTEFRSVLVDAPELLAYCRESMPDYLERWEDPTAHHRASA